MFVERAVRGATVGETERAALQEQFEREVLTVAPQGGIRVPRVPGFKPPILDMAFSEDGNLLVTRALESRRQGEGWVASRVLDVFDSQGRFRLQVTLPDEFIVLGMRGGLLWGRHRRYETGEESVRVYRVE
jgi:hypothetical protein